MKKIILSFLIVFLSSCTNSVSSSSAFSLSLSSSIDYSKMTRVVACSDYQDDRGHLKSQENVLDILMSMEKNGIDEMDGFLCCGDYDYGYEDSVNGISSLKDAISYYIEEDYNKPIFILSHLALNYSMRTYYDGDGQYARFIFDVLNDAGNKGLNIIYLFGHNHSNGWDDYLGGSSVYLSKGDSILVAEYSKEKFNEHTLNFTYLNAGYVGYYRDVNEGADTTLTMTVFDIYYDKVIINRYSKDGLHLLKSKGVTNTYKNETQYEPNLKEYPSPQINILEKNISDIKIDIISKNKNYIEAIC